MGTTRRNLIKGSLLSALPVRVEEQGIFLTMFMADPGDEKGRWKEIFGR